MCSKRLPNRLIKKSFRAYNTSMLVVISITLTAVFLLFADKLLLLFGASENTLPYALDYILIYCMGTIFVQLTLGLNAFNALVIGILGLPGFVLLLLTQWVL